jgi:hypothetical protein
MASGIVDQILLKERGEERNNSCGNTMIFPFSDIEKQM